MAHGSARTRGARATLLATRMQLIGISMSTLRPLFDNNQRWSARLCAEDPGFFERLSRQQSPEYLWIGCSDSRVPANEIIGLAPGEVFVHRNIANLVVHSDLNCLSVIQFAVDVLQVRHIMVVGHYGCGGVQAVLSGTKIGLSDNWLQHVHDVRAGHGTSIARLAPGQNKVDFVCELNVVEQVFNVCRTTIVQEAWRRGQPLQVHGWIYGLRDGLLRDIAVTVAGADEVAARRHAALDGIIQRYTG